MGVILDPLTNLIPMPDFIKELFATLGKNDLPTFLTVVIAGPVLEELLFRGIVLDGFLKTYSPVKSIIWSSIIFSLFHLNPWQAIPAFLIGLVLGYVYWKTQSLLPCIFIHFINNFISWLIGIIVTEDIYTLSELITNQTHYFLVLAGSALLLIPAFRMLIRILKPPHPSGSDS